MGYIILADDDPLVGVLVRHKLKTAGHDVCQVADGQAAMLAIEEQRPDLLILDAMMPIMSGPQVLKKLKENEETAGIPIVMLTARKAESDVVGALEDGANDYITKPFLPDEFALRIRRVLEANRL